MYLHHAEIVPRINDAVHLSPRCDICAADKGLCHRSWQKFRRAQCHPARELNNTARAVMLFDWMSAHKTQLTTAGNMTRNQRSSRSNSASFRNDFGMVVIRPRAPRRCWHAARAYTAISHAVGAPRSEVREMINDSQSPRLGGFVTREARLGGEWWWRCIAYCQACALKPQLTGVGRGVILRIPDPNREGLQSEGRSAAYNWAPAGHRDFEEELTRLDGQPAFRLKEEHHVLREDILEIVGEAEGAETRADRA